MILYLAIFYVIICNPKYFHASISFITIFINVYNFSLILWKFIFTIIGYNIASWPIFIIVSSYWIWMVYLFLAIKNNFDTFYIMQ